MTDKEIKILITAETNKASAEIKKLNGDIAKLNKQTKNVGKGAKNVDQLTRSFRQLATHVGKLMIIYGSAKGLITATGLMLEMEDALTDVSKTTGLAGEDLKKFDTQLQTLAQNMKGITYTELLGISATAGQLGIEGTQNLLTFTEAIAKIAVATEFTAEEASIAFGRLANATGTPIEGVEALASAVNELSTTTASSVSEIVLVSQKMAGTARTFGLMAHETVAFSAVMKDLGITTEVAGSSFKKIMGEMLANTADFAKFAGLEVEEFAQIMQDKPTKALELFFKALQKLNARDAIQALDALGLKGLEVSDTALKMAGAIDKTSKALETSKKGFEENVSIFDEYILKSKTAKASLASFRSSIQILVKKLGDSLLPVLAKSADEIANMINNADPATIKEWAEGIGEATQIIAELIIGLTKAIGAIAKFSTENQVLVKSLLELAIGIVIMRKLALALGVIGGAKVLGGLAGLTAGIRGVSVALVGLGASNPIFLGLALAIAGTVAIVNKYEEVVQNITTATNNMKTATEASSSALLEYQTAVIAINNGSKLLVSEKAKFLVKLNDEAIALQKAIKLHKETANQSKTNANTLLALEASYDKVVEAIQHLLKQEVAEELDDVGDSAEGSAKKVDKITEAFKSLASEESKRIGVQQTVLDKLALQERQHLNKIAGIFREKLAIERKYQNERTGLEDDHTRVMYEANNKGLNDYKQYQNSRKRIDELIKKGREASEGGDLSKAQEYYAEALSLAEGYAGEVIEVDKEIRKYNSESGKWEVENIKETKVAKEQTLKDYQTAYKAIHAEQIEIINKKKVKELEANQAKLKIVELELTAVKAQIQAQLALIETITKYFSALKNGDTSINTDALKASLIEIDTAIKNSKAEREGLKVKAQLLTEEYKSKKQALDAEVAEPTTATVNVDLQGQELTLTEHRLWLAKIELEKARVNIDANVDEAQAKVDALQAEVDAEKVDVEIEAEIDPAVKEIETLNSTIQQVNTTLPPLILDNSKAIESLNKVTDMANTTVTTSLHNLDASNAYNTMNDLVASLNSLVTSHTHYIYPERVGFATGGLVGGMGDIPRFADGGFLRKKGKIAGHDLTGSDDVKALLTRGEFVIPTSAVDYYGVEAMEKIRAKQAPKFAKGGAVKDISRFADGGFVSNKAVTPRFSSGGIVGAEAMQKLASGGVVTPATSTSSSEDTAKDRKTVNLNLKIGDKIFPTVSEEYVATALAEFLQRSEF